MQNFEEGMELSKDAMMYTVYASLLLNLFAIGNLEHLVALIRCLQIMLSLPIYKVVMPAQTVTLTAILIKVAMFDVMEAEWTTDYILSYPEIKQTIYD